MGQGGYVTVGVIVTACEQNKHVWKILYHCLAEVCPLSVLFLVINKYIYLCMFGSDNIFDNLYSLKDLKHLMQINSDSSTTPGFCTGFCVKDYNGKQQFWENNDFCVAQRTTEEEEDGGKREGNNMRLIQPEERPQIEKLLSNI